MVNRKSRTSFSNPITSIAAIAAVILSCSQIETPTTTSEPDDKLQISTLESEKETPTSQALPPAQLFSIDNAETVTPENIFEEVSYATVGGGGGPGECPYYDPNSPSIGLDNKIELNSDGVRSIKFSVCGWEFDEQINLEIKTPKGDNNTETITATRPYYSNDPNDRTTFAIVDYSYILNSDEYGHFEFSFSGKSGFFKNTVYVQSPNLAMRFQLDNSGQYAYYIQGLYPNENVLFTVYRIVMPDELEYNGNRNTFKFVASDNFTSNSKGELLIKTSDEFSGFIAAIGDVSGLIPYYDGLRDVEQINLDGSCVANALGYPRIVPSRLKIGDYAYVAFEPPQANILRDGPGKQNEMINKIYPGDVIELINGPICIDGVNWWNVKGIDRNFEGWTSEGEGEYWLVPCSPKNQACP